MDKRRPCLLTAARVGGLGLLGLGLVACVGTEADVLSVRPLPDLAVADSGERHIPDATPASCTMQTLNTSQCLEVSLWLGKVQAVCTSLGMVPGQVSLTAPCELMKGQGVSFECCPPPQPATCSPRFQGDPMTCRDAKTWLDSAVLDCQSRQEVVQFLVLDQPCAPRGYRQVKYMCCAMAWVPPAAPVARLP